VYILLISVEVSALEYIKKLSPKPPKYPPLLALLKRLRVLVEPVYCVVTTAEATAEPFTYSIRVVPLYVIAI
jgi:hypothetical protein